MNNQPTSWNSRLPPALLWLIGGGFLVFVLILFTQPRTSGTEETSASAAPPVSGQTVTNLGDTGVLRYDGGSTSAVLLAASKHATPRRCICTGPNKCPLNTEENHARFNTSS